MDRIEIEQGLRDIYYDPSTGYQSMERLYKKAIDEGLDVNRKDVKEWLETQKTYTRYKRIIRKHKFRQAIVRYLGEQVQMDLVDMGKYRNKNGGMYWILTAVEVLSRYAFAMPVRKKDTSNMTKAVGKLLKEFKDRFKIYPKLAQFDNGMEFHNVGVKTLLEGNEIKYFSTSSSKKAAVVERFNKTLKTAMWKYFYAKDTYKWTDVLSGFVSNYNNTESSATTMKPSMVNSNNEAMVWTALFGHTLAKGPVPKFRIDDVVRVSKYKSIFSKGYEANFTEEVFMVSRVLRGDPNVYELVDHEGEVVIGKFYGEELSTVDDKSNTHRIEEIVKTKKVNGEKMVLVKWFGYDSNSNSWIPESSIQDIT